MKVRLVHLIASKIAHVLFLLAGFKFVYKIDETTAYFMLACFAIKLVANELYLFDIIREIEKGKVDELEELFKKTQRKDNDNV